jgi:hypothetical protein
VSAEFVPQISHLDSFRQALSRDPERLRRLDERIAVADCMHFAADDLDDIARLLVGTS